jgi:hypothetical protein
MTMHRISTVYLIFDVVFPKVSDMNNIKQYREIMSSNMSMKLLLGIFRSAGEALFHSFTGFFLPGQ